jgi:hypothetical protein
MIEKFLIRFCASEVRVMIARLHERPEDFDYGSRWRDLAESRQGFTWAERKVLDKEWNKFKKNEKRRDLLNLITNEVINPTPKNSWGVLSHGNFSTALYQQPQNAALQNQLAQYQQAGTLNACTDPRAIYGQNTIHPQRLHP